MQKANQYTFKALLNQQPRDQYSSMLQGMADAMGVGRIMVYRYMNATWDNPINIPPQRLLLAATFWNCTVDDLINHPTTVEP